MTADTVDIRFECKQCAQRMVVAAAAAGLKIACPNCDDELTVPIISLGPEKSPQRESGDRSGKGKRRKTASPASSSDGLGESDLRIAELEGELAAASGERVRRERELKDTREECERLHASVTHTQAELKSFHGERQQSRADLGNVRQRLATMEMQLAAREAELAEAHETVAGLEARATDADGTLAAEREQGSLAILELEQTRDALVDAETQVAAAEVSIERLTAAEAELSRELGEARADLVLAEEVGQRLERAEAELQASDAKFLQADAERRGLIGKLEQARTEAETLRKDLQATETGGELLDLRAKLTESEKERTAAVERLDLTERDLNERKDAEATLREELEIVRAQSDDFHARLEASEESRVTRDNEVLRGIIDRQNAELTQHFRELHRLKRARFGLKLVYALFAIGLLGVVALALKILVPMLTF